MQKTLKIILLLVALIVFFGGPLAMSLCGQTTRAARLTELRQSLLGTADAIADSYDAVAIELEREVVGREAHISSLMGEKDALLTQRASLEARLSEATARVKELEELASPSFPAIGVNLDGPTDWNRSLFFINVLRTARPAGHPDHPWGAGVWDHKADKPLRPNDNVPRDARGYPTTPGAPFSMLVMDDQVDVSGTYKFRCKGKVERIGGVASNIAIRGLAFDGTYSTAEIDLPAKGGTLRFQPAAGVVLDEMELIRPGYTFEQAREQVWGNEIIEFLKPTGTIRCMDLSVANESRQMTWDGRATRADLSYHKYDGKGVPIEDMLLLGRLTGRPVWICLSIHWSYEDLARACKFIRENKSPDQLVFIEPSNEIWNTNFPQYQINQAKANAEAQSDPALAAYPAGQKRNAARVAKVWAFLAKEIGYPQRKDVRVVGATFINNLNSWLASQVDYLVKHAGGGQPNICGVAFAPYYGTASSFFANPDVTSPDYYFGPWEEKDDKGNVVRGDNFLYDKAIRPYHWMSAELLNGLVTALGVPKMCYEAGPDGGQFLTVRKNLDNPENFERETDPLISYTTTPDGRQTWKVVPWREWKTALAQPPPYRLNADGSKIQRPWNEAEALQGQWNAADTAAKGLLPPFMIDTALPAKIAAANDPRMYDADYRFLRGLKDAGVEMVCRFTGPGRRDRYTTFFPMTDDVRKTDTPQVRAVWDATKDWKTR